MSDQRTTDAVSGPRGGESSPAAPGVSGFRPSNLRALRIQTESANELVGLACEHAETVRAALSPDADQAPWELACKALSHCDMLRARLTCVELVGTAGLDAAEYDLAMAEGALMSLRDLYIPPMTIAAEIADTTTRSLVRSIDGAIGGLQDLRRPLGILTDILTEDGIQGTVILSSGGAA